MARVHQRNSCYRTKEQIVEDVVFILKAPITKGTKAAVLSNVCSTWTEFSGKYKGCRYWSARAIEAREIDPHCKLKHEHIVPKKVVMTMLFALSPPTPAAVRAILDELFIGVVVTPEEDNRLNAVHRSTMPRDFFDTAHPNCFNAWLRYIECNIQVFEYV